MFVESRTDSRGFFLRVWRRMSAGEALEPLEQVVAQVIASHPEYHPLLSQPEQARTADFGLHDNPFLHMGLHIALVEQLHSDRPAGVRTAYQRLLSAAAGDAHRVEHRMMECLAETLQQAGSDAGGADEAAYLACLGRIAP